MANEIIAEYVHWRDTCDGKQFVIMWSDHTLETIRCPFTDYWIGKKILQTVHGAKQSSKRKNE